MGECSTKEGDGGTSVRVCSQEEGVGGGVLEAGRRDVLPRLPLLYKEEQHYSRHPLFPF